MNWEVRLISLYLFVCKHYQENLFSYCERMTNHTHYAFTDEETITLYLYGILEGHHKLKSIHSYAQKHLMGYFPNLPGYSGFSHRINQVNSVFAPLVDIISTQMTTRMSADTLTGIIDAMPIVMAQRGRRFKAKVAPDIATNNGYCATKKFFYYGVKLHVLGCRQQGKMPVPTCIALTDAGMHDRKAFEQILPFLPDEMNQCYADKAYQIENKPLHQESNVEVLTPVKKAKGQKYLDADEQWLSTAISSVRQPIESFFNWIHEKTGIQMASKVRSTNGLMVHVFGRLAAALFLMKDMYNF